MPNILSVIHEYQYKDYSLLFNIFVNVYIYILNTLIQREYEYIL